MHKEHMRQVLDQIRADPAGFAMATYGTRDECGTTMCLAGYAAVAAGYELIFINGRASDCRDGSKVRSIHSLARQYLGLDVDDAGYIFMTMTDSVDELQRAIERITGETLGY